MGTLPFFLSILSFSTATVLPLGRVTGWRSSTTPTRKPPARTSLPLTRLEPLSICSLYWRGGTKGRALLGLLARKTAPITTSGGAAPTSTRVGTIEEGGRPPPL